MRSRRDPVAWVALAAATVALVVAGFIALPLVFGGQAFHGLPFVGTGPSGAQTPAAPPSGIVEPRAGQAITSTYPGGVAQPPLPAQPTRLSVPAVGLDASVGAMSVAAGGSVDPPTPGSAYWLSGSSVAGPTSTGTTYLAGHTYRGGGRAVFNPFLDIPHSRYTVHKGDRIVVGTPSGSWAYTVTDTELYLKTTVEQQTELWRNVPGRLVVVTCFQYDGGTSSQQNFVVYAQLDR